MNITRNNIDALNAVITVEIAKNDYADKVERVLADYRKNASIKGFRKGTVPMSLINKQYITFCSSTFLSIINTKKFN